MWDHEIEVAAEAGIPEVIPGLTAKLKFRYAATKRQRFEALMTEVSVKSGVTEEQLGEQLESSEDLRDLFEPLILKAVQTSDPLFQRALAQVLTQAFEDTKINLATELLAHLQQLRPVHLRLLVQTVALAREVDLAARLGSGEGLPKYRIRVPALAERLGLTDELVVSAFDRLDREGLVAHQPDGTSYYPTKLAYHIIGSLFPGVDVDELATYALDVAP